MKLISNNESLKIFIIGLQIQDAFIREFPDLKLRKDIKIEYDK